MRWLSPRLGIRTIYDLRSEGEREVRPDRVPEGMAYASVGHDRRRGGYHTPSRIMASLPRPAEGPRELRGRGGRAKMFLAHYREFVNLPSARRALGHLFSDLAEGQRLPSLVHCMGQAKIGPAWAAAAFQLLLGVPDDAVSGPVHGQQRSPSGLHQRFREASSRRAGGIPS